MSSSATSTARKKFIDSTRWLTSTPPAIMKAGWAKLITRMDL